MFAKKTIDKKVVDQKVSAILDLKLLKIVTVPESHLKWELELQADLSYPTDAKSQPAYLSI